MSTGRGQPHDTQLITIQGPVTPPPPPAATPQREADPIPDTSEEEGSTALDHGARRRITHAIKRAHSAQAYAAQIAQNTERAQDQRASHNNNSDVIDIAQSYLGIPYVWDCCTRWDIGDVRPRQWPVVE